MKQRRIKELYISHYELGSTESYTPSREEEYAAVVAQAEAHQDLRFHTEIEGVETLIILPWESVIGVYATYETAEVTAPTDAICESDCSFEITPLVYDPDNFEPFDISEEDDKCWVVVGTDMMASITFNGETIDDEEGIHAFAEESTVTIDGATIEPNTGGLWDVPVACDAEEVTFVEHVIHNGCSAQFTITWPIAGTD